jgi:hypothetical protein
MWWHRGTIGSFISVAKTKYIISMCWYGQFFFKFQTEIFISNFKNEKFQSFPFLISKMKTSKFFFISNFRGIFLFFFHFPPVVWPTFFQISKLIFSIFSISLWWYGHFFSKFENKNFNSNFKNDFFKKFYINFFLWHKRIFFSTRGCQIY